MSSREGKPDMAGVDLAEMGPVGTEAPAVADAVSTANQLAEAETPGEAGTESAEIGPVGTEAPAVADAVSTANQLAEAETPNAAAELAGDKPPEAKRSRNRKKMDRTKRRMKDAQKELAGTKDMHKPGANDEVMIKFDHVTKTFKLYKNDRGRFLGMFNIKRKGSYLGSVNANDDLSFEVRKGESVSFLGLNGAGKSTALKMITGVSYPTKGEVIVNGSVSALLELTAGFNKKLTGRENIHLRGQILGMSEEEITALEPTVVKFADLGVYIDQPVKSYSSGMRARLGFAFAVSIEPEILVIDEALSVGDRAFRRKCIKRIREIIMDENVTVLCVTHSPSTARTFCNRGIVLDHGKKVFDGDIDEAIKIYEGNY